MAEFDPDAYLAEKSQPSGGFDPDAYLGKTSKRSEEYVITPEGIAFTDPKAQMEMIRGQSEAAKGLLSGLGQTATGIGEMVPGAVGRASARGTQALQQVGAPEAQQVGRFAGAFIPAGTGLKAAEYGAKGLKALTGGIEALPAMLRPAARIGKAATYGAAGGAAAGAATPTGVESGEQRAEEKIKEAKSEASKGALLGGGLGTVGQVIGGVRAARAALRPPTPIGSPAGYVAIGEKVEKALTGPKAKFIQERKAEANTLYNDAKQIAAAKQSAGEPFAVSPPGQALLQRLENAKYRIDAQGQKFLKGEEEVKGLDRLIDAIKGKTSGGGVTVKTLPKGQIKSFAPKSTIEKDIDAVVEELRFLRDFKPGQQIEGYKGLSEAYRRNLADNLEKALYTWSPEYKAADVAYKAASEKLRPYDSNLMRRILQGEKYDKGELAKDTETFAKEIFSSRDKVAEFNKAAGDPQLTNELARDYLATIFDNQTPQQIKKFVSDPANDGWMREANVKDIAQRFAEQATKVESRTDILKKIAKGVAIGGGVLTVGSAATWPLRKLLP